MSWIRLLATRVNDGRALAAALLGFRKAADESPGKTQHGRHDPTGGKILDHTRRVGAAKRNSHHGCTSHHHTLLLWILLAGNWLLETAILLWILLTGRRS